MVAEHSPIAPTVNDSVVVRFGVPVVLFSAAAAGWWWSIRMASEMRGDMAVGDMGGMAMTSPPMSSDSALGAVGFGVAWLAMMAAMMLPAITPVVQLYARAATAKRVAPLPYFVSGYLLVWMVLVLPAYFAWRRLEMPLARGDNWAARVAGGSFVAAGVWQFSPLKGRCLRHCRSPLSFFMRYAKRLERPLEALRLGTLHGLVCVGCCWVMFALLVALGTMNIGWMLVLTFLIVVEKSFRQGFRVAAIAGALFLVAGFALLASPDTITTIT